MLFTPSRGHRRARNIAAAVAVLGVSVVTSAQMASASASASVGQSGAASTHLAAKHASAKPTIVLVHGAWADASSWSGVTQRLQALGYTVVVPPVPLRGVASDTAYLKDFLTTISGPIVLVGHSYGGMVTTNAAVGNSQVKALVYDDAFVPAQGETVMSIVTAKPGSLLAQPPQDVFNFVPFPGAPAGVVDLYVKTNLFGEIFAANLPATQINVLSATQSPIASSAVSEPSGPPAWATIPSWDVIGLQDNAIPPAEQLSMARRANSHIVKIDAPHLSLITNPGDVTATIVAAAKSTGDDTPSGGVATGDGGSLTAGTTGLAVGGSMAAGSAVLGAVAVGRRRRARTHA
jgi:pimeloyl-ACP methyl ester carboxylesterase